MNDSFSDSYTPIGLFHGHGSPHEDLLRSSVSSVIMKVCNVFSRLSYEEMSQVHTYPETATLKRAQVRNTHREQRRSALAHKRQCATKRMSCKID